MNQLQSRDYTKCSESIKANYQKTKNDISTMEIYDIKQFKAAVDDNDLDRFRGKTKHRTLIKEDPILYKSIIYYTDKFSENYYMDGYKPYWSERLSICQRGFVFSDDMTCLCGKNSSFDKQTQDYSKQFCKDCWISSCSKEWFKHKYGENWEDEYIAFHAVEDRKLLRQKIGRKSWYIRKGKKFHGCLSKGKNESNILDFIENKNTIKIKRGEPVDGYYVDGYCEETNTVYEVYEKYHKYQQSYDDTRRINIMDALKCDFVILYDNNESNLEEITIKRYDKTQ